MKTQKLKFTDFEIEKLSKDQQKIVRGGDVQLAEPIDPGNGKGKGSN